MEWTVDVDAQHGYVRVKTSGTFSVPDHLRMIDDILSRSFWVPGKDAFFDHRLLDMAGVTFQTMQAASQNHLRNNTRIGNGKAAILMGSPAAFGSARQFELLVDGQAGADLRVFLDEEAALHWLVDGA